MDGGKKRSYIKFIAPSKPEIQNYTSLVKLKKRYRKLEIAEVGISKLKADMAIIDEYIKLKKPQKDARDLLLSLLYKDNFYYFRRYYLELNYP